MKACAYVSTGKDNDISPRQEWKTSAIYFIRRLKRTASRRASDRRSAGVAAALMVALRCDALFLVIFKDCATFRVTSLYEHRVGRMHEAATLNRTGEDA